MPETFTLETIPEADAEKTYTCDVQFILKETKEGRGEVEKPIKLRVEYRALTTSIVNQSSYAAQCAASILSMVALDEEGKTQTLVNRAGEVVTPTVEFFNSRPTPFCKRMWEGIVEDFFPRATTA